MLVEIVFKNFVLFIMIGHLAAAAQRLTVNAADFQFDSRSGDCIIFVLSFWFQLAEFVTSCESLHSNVMSWKLGGV